ncbi:MAG: S-adenosylmethionine:tRNA ribosyltransferase-isomerase [Bacteroidales bacterium]|jgi:S-adenosylmethionine:tRNA ribosyltransferase-isomerase
MNINLDEYNYNLPADRIAMFPADKRSNSKLLIYKENKIIDEHFYDIGKYLPQNTLFLYNNTKVFHARLKFFRSTGAEIEVFCLEPVEPHDISLSMSETKTSTWKCLVGNSRKWKNKDEILTLTKNINNKDCTLSVIRISNDQDSSIIKFSWNNDLSFAEILEIFGEIPLPPYIHRNSIESDNDRYQTVFAKAEGSVAAPTAGLHFTDKLIETLKNEGKEFLPLTLHVGAGTFKPVKTDDIKDHKMHSENIIFTRQFIEEIYKKIDFKFIVPVGTTSCRSLESLYWIGVMLGEKTMNFNDTEIITLPQWYPYQNNKDIPIKESLKNILSYLDKTKQDHLEAFTELIIIPGYKMKLLDALVTNFHQPNSTLLLLIASILNDNWKIIYNHALNNNYRFLSYGDSCLFFK